MDQRQRLLRETIRLLLTEKASLGGSSYEQLVFDSIKAAGASGKMTHTAGFDANLPDADITVNGEVYNVEVKMDATAQMGGGSVAYRDGQFQATGHDSEAMQPVAQELNDSPTAVDLASAIDKLAKFLSRGAGKKITGFPMTGFLKTSWDKAVKAGLLVPINTKIESSIDFIASHYAKKGTHYIQIGGSGLFFLSDNPADLPVPKLTGSVLLEIRAARAGSGGHPTAGAGLRVQPRLKITGKSPYTLDDPESIKAMLDAVVTKDVSLPQHNQPDNDQPSNDNFSQQQLLTRTA